MLLHTFSFYLLIVLHAAVTVFFATFNGRYLRYEHELAKKNKEEPEHSQDMEDATPNQEEHFGQNFGPGNHASETHPLLAKK